MQVSATKGDMFSFLKSRPHHNPHRSCPDCGAKMSPYQCEDALIDRCLDCNGIWFDAREIGQFRVGLEKLDPESFKTSKPVEAVTSSVFLSTCPVCRVPLDEGRYASDSKISVKRCERCEGIWLSSDEVLRFADFVRVGKALAPHVKEIAKGQREMIAASQNFDNAAGAVNKHLTLMQRLTMQRYFRHGYGVILPVYDENSRDTFPWVTSSLIAINIFIFLLVGYDSSIWRTLGIVPSEVWKNGSLITLLSSQYLHSGIFHLLGNCFFLWIFGDNVEDKLGPLKFFFLYTVLGVISGLTYALLNPFSDIPAIGASGAISGIFGAYFVLFPKSVIHTLIFGQIFRLHIAIYLIVWILLNLLDGWKSAAWGIMGNAWEVHLAGLGTGIGLMFFLKRPRKLKLLDSEPPLAP